MGHEHDRAVRARCRSRSRSSLSRKRVDLVERREGLVHQQQAAACSGKRARDRDAHLHAAGEFARIGLRKIAQADEREALLDALPRVAPGHAAQAAAAARHCRPHWPRASASVPGTRSRSRRDDPAAPDPGQSHRPRGRLGQARDEAQSRRLAAAGGAEQGHELAVADVQVDRSASAVTPLAKILPTPCSATSVDAGSSMTMSRCRGGPACISALLLQVEPDALVHELERVGLPVVEIRLEQTRPSPSCRRSPSCAHPSWRRCRALKVSPESTMPYSFILATE